MNILINSLSAKQGGGQTYLSNLIKYLPDDNNTTFFVLCSYYNQSLFKTDKHNIRIISLNIILSNSLLRTLFELFVLPFMLKKLDIHLYYQPAAGIPIIIPKKCKTMTTLQNMLLLDSEERRRFPLFSMVRLKLSILSFFILKALRQSDKVIFISSYSQAFVKRIVHNIDSKSMIIPHGLDHLFLQDNDDLDISTYGLKENEYYLYVSTLDYYKAQNELVEEWEILSQTDFKYPLVLTGFLSRKKYVNIVYNTISKYNLANKVIITGPIEHQKLSSFYHKARALIFASSCECCPNILLEKMSSGKPLFVSEYPPMPEFAQNVPVYFNPYHRGDLAKKILDFEANPHSLLKRSSTAIQLIQQYTWEKTASDTLTFMKD